MIRTAVYSGSFDPLHKGHLAVIETLCRSGLFDRVRLVVSPQSPFKDASRSDNALQRLQAAREAAARHPELPITVDDIEMTMPAPQYTVRTLDTLRQLHPDEVLTLVVGADQIGLFRKWRDYGRILTDYGVAVFPRDGSDLQAIRTDLLNENPLFRITLMQMPEVPVSSTQIRDAIAHGEDVSEYLM